jgi:hypothetical protein
MLKSSLLSITVFAGLPLFFVEPFGAVANTIAFDDLSERQGVIVREMPGTGDNPRVTILNEQGQPVAPGSACPNEICGGPNFFIVLDAPPPLGTDKFGLVGLSVGGSVFPVGMGEPPSFIHFTTFNPWETDVSGFFIGEGDGSISDAIGINFRALQRGDTTVSLFFSSQDGIGSCSDATPCKFDESGGQQAAFGVVWSRSGPPSGSTVVDMIAFRSDVEVPDPIVGTGLPGLILAGGVLLLLARRRRQQTA